MNVFKKLFLKWRLRMIRSDLLFAQLCMVSEWVTELWIKEIEVKRKLGIIDDRDEYFLAWIKREQWV